MSTSPINLMKKIMNEYEKNINIDDDELELVESNLRKLNKEQLEFYFTYKDDKSIRNANTNGGIKDGTLLPITERGKKIFETAKNEEDRYPPNTDNDYPEFIYFIPFEREMETWSPGNFERLGSGWPLVKNFQKLDFKKELSNKTRRRTVGTSLRDKAFYQLSSALIPYRPPVLKKKSKSKSPKFKGGKKSMKKRKTYRTI